jgi:hypothetical protein
MSAISREIHKLTIQGYCCSQIMVQMGLDANGDENPELVDAVSGLCRGLYSGLVCGTLTGAACLLAMIDKTNAASIMIPKLIKWFEATYTLSCGGINCREITSRNPVNEYEHCPKIMEETYEKCRELLAEFGHQI